MSNSDKPAGFGVMPPIDIAPILEANRRGLEAATQANSHALHRMAKVNLELFGFATRRLERDRAAIKDLTACKSPQDAMALFGTFFETAMRQYSEEISQISAMYAEQAAEALSDAKHEIAKATETPPER